jgi:hypothetical protein
MAKDNLESVSYFLLIYSILCFMLKPSPFAWKKTYKVYF